MKKNKSKKTIAVIGTVGIPAKYGGFETLAEHLVKHLTDEYNVIVYCTSKKYPKDQRLKEYLGAKLVYLPIDANGIQSILYDCLSIFHALFFADALLVLGVSGGFMLPFVRLFTNCRLIVSIDGIEWKRAKWIKPAKWYLWWAEKVAVKYSHADISDNESIQDYTAYRYKTLSHIIEYGADHTMKIVPTEDHYAMYPFLKKPFAFKVCRIEPENNIHIVLKAFSATSKFPIVMIGNWNNSDYGLQLRETYKECENIILLDPIYDQGKLDLIRSNASLYVHGHSAGGTNPSLVEAMYLGLPIVAFHVSYNKTTTENKAWYFHDEKELITIIENCTSETLHMNTSIMKEIADRRYTWKIIASKYNFLIKQVLNSKEKVAVHPIRNDIKENELIEMELGHLTYPTMFYEKR